jgi:hypothetical protein
MIVDDEQGAPHIVRIPLDAAARTAVTLGVRTHGCFTQGFGTKPKATG